MVVLSRGANLFAYLSGTIKRGPLSKNRKNRLDPVKIKAKRQLLANPHLVRGYRFSASLEASHVRPRTGNRFSVSLEASNVRPQTGNRFSVSLEAPHVKPRTRCQFSASLEVGSAITPPPPPRPISLIECHIQLNVTNHSHDVSRTMARHNRVANEMGSRINTRPSRTGQGRGYRPLCSVLCP